MLLGALIILLTLVLMEEVAWFVHKSHHTRHSQESEQNDFFFAFYGIFAAIFFIYGSPTLDYRFWIAVGISLYGLLYFLVHDVYIHSPAHVFLSQIVKRLSPGLKNYAQMHHRNTGKEGCEVFGMLLVQGKFFVLARRHQIPNKYT